MNVLSGRLIKIIGLLFIVLLALFFILPHMMNLSKYTKSIINEVQEKTGYQVSIVGEPHIEISNKIRMVVPNLSINLNALNNTQQNILQADAVVITLSWYNFMLGIKNLNSIELTNPSIVLDYIQDFEFASLLKKHFDIDTFILKNANLYYSNSLKNPTFTRVNLKTLFNSNNIAVVKGNFINCSINFDIDASYDYNQGSAQQRALNINVYNSSINANLHTKTGQVGSSGNLKISINNPLIMTNYLAKWLPFLSDYKKAQVQDNIEISSDVYYKDNNVELTNLKILSDSINGNGNLNFSLIGSSNLKVNLNFDKVDINTIFAIGKTQALKVSQDHILEEDGNITVNNSFIDLDFIKDNLSIKVIAKEINLANTNLENFSFNFNLENKTIIDSNIDFNITNKNNSSNFSISSISTRNVDGISILLGQFTNSGNNINDTLGLFGLKDSFSIEEDDLDYSLSAQMVLAPSEISLFDIVGKVGKNEGNFYGSIATRVSEVNNYNIDLKFDHIALDNFNLPILKSRLQDLLVGSDQDNYISKFIWFRTLTSAYIIKFGFTNTEFKNNKIDDLAILCSLTPANMQLRGIIKAPFMNSAFSLDLEALSIKPTINAKVYGNSLDYDLTSSLIAPILPQNHSNNIEDKNAIWSDQNINVFRINKYNANFDVNLKNIKFNNHVLNNFQFTTHTSNDILYVDSLGFDIYNGHIQTTGNISFFAKLLYQFSFSGSNLESRDFFADFAPLMNAFEGPFSFTSSFVTEGLSPKELISNLNISSNFASTGMTINGIDSDVLVDIVLQRKATPKDQILSAINNSLKSGTTNITGLSGSFKGTKGVIQSDNITFKSRFNNVMSAFSLDLNTLSLASNSQFLFMPYSGNTPLTYNIIVSGNLKDSFNHQIDQSNLISYVKSTYNIVTAEDILAAQKVKKVQAKEALQQNQIQDPNDKDYLYYKLLMEENDN